ncbi:hypothetical protein GCM10018965_021240 [Nonomuraea roseola]
MLPHTLVAGVDPWVAEDVGYYLTQEEEEHLTVLDVSGDGREDPGRVRIKVRGKDRTTRSPMASPGVSLPAVVVFPCFDLSLRCVRIREGGAASDDWKHAHARQRQRGCGRGAVLAQHRKGSRWDS